MNLEANEVEFRLRGEWGNIIESLRLIELTHEILTRQFYTCPEPQVLGRARREPGYYLYYVVARPRQSIRKEELNEQDEVHAKLEEK